MEGKLFMKKYWQKGIGLMELMLSLTVIAILIISAARYYQSTKTSQEVTDAVNLVNAIIAATTNYHIDNPSQGTDAIPFASLVDYGYLSVPSGNDGTIASPWGTSISDPYMDEDGAVAIGIASIPSTACKQLAGRLSSGCSGGDPDDDDDTTCGCTEGPAADYKGFFGLKIAD